MTNFVFGLITCSLNIRISDCQLFCHSVQMTNRLADRTRYKDTQYDSQSDGNTRNNNQRDHCGCRTVIHSSHDLVGGIHIRFKGTFYSGCCVRDNDGAAVCFQQFVSFVKITVNPRGDDLIPNITECIRLLFQIGIHGFFAVQQAGGLELLQAFHQIRIRRCRFLLRFQRFLNVLINHHVSQKRPLRLILTVQMPQISL